MLVSANTEPAKPVDRRSLGGDLRSGRLVLLHRASELTWVLTGKFCLLIGNAAIMLFLAHRLALDDYGLLVLTIGLQLLISRILMLGVDVGMLRLSRTTELSKRPDQVVTAGLIVILFNTSALLLISAVVMPLFFWFEVRVWVLASIVAGAIGTALVDYVYGVRLLRHRYPLAAMAQGGTSIWRLGLTSVASLLFPGSGLIVFVTYHGASLISGVAQTLMLGALGRPWPDRALVRGLVNYSRWQGKTNILAIFTFYQGTFLLMLLGQQAATGIFGLGLTLSLGFKAIYNAFFEYLLARIGAIESIDNLLSFLKRAFGVSLALIAVCIPVVFVLALVAPRFLPPEWTAVVPIFYYLAAAAIVLILQAPLEIASHYLLRPQLVSFVWLMRAFFIAISGLILAMALGVIGVAKAQLIGSLLALMLFVVLVYRAYQSATRNPLPAADPTVGLGFSHKLSNQVQDSD